MTRSTPLDLNADIGEGMADDARLLEIITSASIACGGHAGDVPTMRAALRGARANGVRAGAHPGFADPEHFGRRRLALGPEEICRQVVTQTAALMAVAAEEDVPVAYVKLHGALANMAAEDVSLARRVYAELADRWPDLAIMALAGSAQQHAAEALGLGVIVEAYADRGYAPDGLLASRSLPGAVLTDADEIAARCLRLARDGEIVATDGTTIAIAAQSLCVHGDTPGAIAIAAKVRDRLEDAGLLQGKWRN
ncbi:5-oxoprolinase subunit PxpA [Pelagibacterium montanilacus]|uniref:5-oxoprolinase subunit PxpA n=1 Tax=Pelagibacterium montanilacus TaxID=2185280 RepID=UPI000F8F0769|nr:5-oxoprolinase subunit PxpA [Pelagibacterium montanilacus]